MRFNIISTLYLTGIRVHIKLGVNLVFCVRIGMECVRGVRAGVKPDVLNKLPCHKVPRYGHTLTFVRSLACAKV